MTRSDIKGIIILLGFALTTAFVFNQISPYGIAMVGQWDTGKGVVQANAKEGPALSSIEILSPEIVNEMIQSGERTVIDVRSRDTYLQGHLPSALSFPLKEFDDNVPQMLSMISQPDPVLVYCSSVHCTESHTFAEHLKNMGFEDVKVFSGGFRMWQEHGYKIAENEE